MPSLPSRKKKKKAKLRPAPALASLMRTPDQLALLLPKLAPVKLGSLGLGSSMSPPPSLAGFHGSIYARNVMFSLPDDVSPTPEVKPEASYLALFISMLIQCQSAREILKALGCGLLHPTAGIPGSPLPPPHSVPGPHSSGSL